ncbi:MAG: tetraacyldisaccharide 4'-kinase [Candidatus Binatia bacterium]
MSILVDRVRDVVWNRRGVSGWAAWLALQPACGLFATAVALRRYAYRVGVLHVHHAPIPVVSVGNLSVGGTGKTPVTLWLARRLAAAGLRVGILLRGYSGRASGVTVVAKGAGPEADVETAGDEAVMLAKCFDGVVVAARCRADGVAAAAQLGCEVVVLDDGFQHLALARDFDLVLVSGGRRSLLPAGPMRESPAALRRADAVGVVVKDDDAGMVVPDGAQPCFVVRFAPTALIESEGGSWRERPLGLLSGRRIAAVAGVANPVPFYTAVRQWETQIEEIFEFPDHHAYTRADWQQIMRGTREIEMVVTTEKDLVKLEHFPFPRGKLVALRIAPQVEGAETLVAMILERVRLPRAAA